MEPVDEVAYGLICRMRHAARLSHGVCIISCDMLADQAEPKTYITPAMKGRPDEA